MKPTIYAPHKAIGAGMGFLILAGTGPVTASSAADQKSPTPVQHHQMVASFKINTEPETAVDNLHDSALPRTPAIFATGLSKGYVSPKRATSNLPPASFRYSNQSSTTAANSDRHQPRSSSNGSFDWIWLSGLLGFSGFIIWRFLTNLSSGRGNRKSSDNSFDFGSHDSGSDSSSYSDYGNYGDSGDFGGGGSDGSGDGGDW